MAFDKAITIPEGKPLISFEVSSIVEETPHVQEVKLKKCGAKNYEVHICIPCKRLFRCIETLNKHKLDSILHIKVTLPLTISSQLMSCSRGGLRKRTS